MAEDHVTDQLGALAQQLDAIGALAQQLDVPLEVKPTHSMTVAPSHDAPSILRRVLPHTVSVPEAQVEQVLERWGDSDGAEARRVRSAHQAIEEGRQLVSLRRVVEHGLNGPSYSTPYAPGFPGLAIVRADMRDVTCSMVRNGTVRYSARRAFHGHWSYAIAGPHAWTGAVRWQRARASVPPIPVTLRPKRPAEYVLVWEPTWREVRQRHDRQILVDPALLEQVVGDLYVVTAAWELTELEAAALGGT